MMGVLMGLSPLLHVWQMFNCPVKQGTVFSWRRVSGIRDSHVVDIWAYEARSSPYRIERDRGCRGFGLSANDQVLFVIKKRRRTLSSVRSIGSCCIPLLLPSHIVAHYLALPELQWQSILLSLQPLEPEGTDL